ncbi:MAG: hypothetical protein V4661_14785 [Pseudomonadota bacterium]
MSTTHINDMQDEIPDISDTTREYLLSDAGIAHFMRLLSDANENWRDCPVKRCRRARGCQGPDMICQLREPRLNAPRDDVARINAGMRQRVLRDLERFGIW